MSRSHFEKLVEDEMSNCKDAAIRSPIGDSHGHAKIVGVYEGLNKALSLYRQAVRIDADEGPLT
jgi:hypothetical protein